MNEKKLIGFSVGMMNSLILATALIYNIKVVTCDKHFSDLENTVML